ncbi:MAG: MgtC/SapB family protein [Ginsengibacter sp.]
MLEWYEILGRLLLAALFGGFVGLERERKSWAAGLRTHMMVCVGSALIMMVSSFGFADILGTPNVNLDPSRIAAQVVSGIGFIGAGTILFSKEGGTIRGLTTAAGLWTVAGIGLATGGGMYVAAIFTTILALIILWALKPLENKYVQRFRPKTLKIITNEKANTSEILKSLEELEETSFSDFSLSKFGDEFVLQLKFDESDASKLADVVARLQQNTNVKQVFWSK